MNHLETDLNSNANNFSSLNIPQTGMDFFITINNHQLKIQEQTKSKVKNTCDERFNLKPTQ